MITQATSMIGQPVPCIGAFRVGDAGLEYYTGDRLEYRGLRVVSVTPGKTPMHSDTILADWGDDSYGFIEGPAYAFKFAH